MRCPVCGPALQPLDYAGARQPGDRPAPTDGTTRQVLSWQSNKRLVRLLVQDTGPKPVARR